MCTPFLTDLFQLHRHSASCSMRRPSATPSRKRLRVTALLLSFVAVLFIAAASWQLSVIIQLHGYTKANDHPTWDQILTTHTTPKATTNTGTITTNTTKPLKPTFTIATPTALDRKETKFDLVFWSKSPLFHVDTKTSNILITRFFWESGRPLNGWEEVVTVDFRICNRQCPSLPSNSSSTKFDLSSLAQYKKNWNRKLKIYSTLGRFASARDQLPIKNVVAITFWSQELQQHIPIPDYYAASTQLLKCSTTLNSTPCPKPCPQNHYHLDYPYYYDPTDRLCKASHPSAIPPFRKHAGHCNCEFTCFTPQGNAINSTWPWRDAAERDYYAPYWNSPLRQRQIRRHYLQARTQRRNRTEFQSYQPRFACPSTAGTPPPIPHAITGDFYHHLFFVPQAKLIFCGIPKVGISEWVKFFRHVMGAGDYLSLPHYKVDRTYFLVSSLEPTRAQKILNDPTWTKAVFFRNPLDRLLSSYMDKILQQGYTQRIFRMGNLSDPVETRPVLSFAEFVDKIADTTNLHNCTDPTGLKACTDPHWKPQLMTCGLDYLLPKFDFVGSFDYLSNHTKLLLERVGAWDKHGSTFDDGRGRKQRNTCAVPTPQRPVNYSSLGFNQRGPSVTGNQLHATGSKSLVEQYYTPELIAKVRQAYALDFAVWDELSAKPSHDVLSGKDLKVVQDYCASRSIVS